MWKKLSDDKNKGRKVEKLFYVKSPVPLLSLFFLPAFPLIWNKRLHWDPSYLRYTPVLKTEKTREQELML